ncbi:MAG: hypothetical protein Q9227_000506 [Pyrenula ochraceoflavens]
MRKFSFTTLFLLILSLHFLLIHLSLYIVSYFSPHHYPHPHPKSHAHSSSTDLSPGIGLEFETSHITFEPSAAFSLDKWQTFTFKRECVGNRRGKGWALTADTTRVGAHGGVLTAEYVVEGEVVKLGSSGSGGGLKRVVGEILEDLRAWSPSRDMDDNRVTIGGSKDGLNTWRITRPETSNKASIDRMVWLPQINAPMPLEAIYELLRIAIFHPEEKSNVLLPTQHMFRGTNFVYVTRDFFPGDFGETAGITDDVLGFLSILLSYAKGAGIIGDKRSPKLLFMLMPRTDFKTMYGLVRHKIPWNNLFRLVEQLACWKWDDGKVVLDALYCHPPKKPSSYPIPNGSFAALFYSLGDPPNTRKLLIRDWINSIADLDSAGTDELAKIDPPQSIGGLRDTVAHVFGTQRAVPIWEFRSLPSIVTTEFGDFADRAERAVLDYHREFKREPTKSGNLKTGEQRSAQWLVKNS